MVTRLENALTNLRLRFLTRIAERLNLPADEVAIREKMWTMSDREVLSSLDRGRQHLTASDLRLLDLPFAERSLVASIEGNGITFAVCVFHAPPGASHGKIKPQSMVSVADWLSAQKRVS